MKTLLFVCNLLLCLGITGCRQNEKELKITAYVNPFIGTDGHGHCIFQSLFQAPPYPLSLTLI